jgi:hypothetical protein
MKRITAEQLTLVQGEAVVDGADNVWLPFDLPHLPVPPDGWARLSSRRDVRHAGRLPFHWHPPASGTLHLLNGMGVTLGDSIIGMNALAWLKARHPALRIQLHRTPHALPFVERLYQLASHIVEPVAYLPRPLHALPEEVVDLSDFLYWSSFDSEPMVDFFIRGLGLDPHEVSASAKANRWLSHVALPGVNAPWPYVLFCDQASTPLRTVPQEHAAQMVERIWREYGLPVLGFHSIPHPHYRDISEQSRSLDEYIAWIKASSVVIGTDSSAIHIAAGFDVPTMAVFVSIDPLLRARDYQHCRVLDVRTELTNGLHQSEDPEVLQEVRRIWRGLVGRSDLPWPAPATPLTSVTRG